jgi:histidyl-tRNA synthetase
MVHYLYLCVPIASFILKNMIIKDTTYRGTRILYGAEALKKMYLIDRLVAIATENDFEPIMIPVIQYQETFKSKVGEENNNMMFNFKDRGDRDICLAPEYTAVVQQLAGTTFKNEKDVKLFYVQECFRGERPQAGRYRQFTQFGIEILNPTKDYMDELILLAEDMIAQDGFTAYEVDRTAVRGLDYYKEGKGFEISIPELGAQKQVCGGGEYEGGVGFAIGVDRILLV